MLLLLLLLVLLVGGIGWSCGGFVDRGDFFRSTHNSK